MNENLLEVRNVTKIFDQRKSRRTVALKNVSFSMKKDVASTLAIVGESGSGKSTLANNILGFQVPTAGGIYYDSTDISKLNKMSHIRYRKEVQAIFQNPFEAFNPFYKIDHVFSTIIERFKLADSKKEAAAIVEKSIESVRLDPSGVLGKYSYQLSGGQLQRIMFARTLLLQPRIMIADEPVSMIDASLRVTVLDIMVRLKKENDISQIYITHDLSTALQISDDIIVMYKGCILEKGSAAEVIQSPKHPYTQLLISCIPLPSPDEKWTAPVKVNDIKNSNSMSDACCFCDKCPYTTEKCFERTPMFIDINEGHSVACYLYSD